MNVDVGDCSIVVAVVLNIGAVPVDESSRPIYRSLAVRSQTSGPQRKLDPCWTLWVVKSVACRVPCFTSLQRAGNLSIDGPSQLIRLPIDFVGVRILKCIRNGQVFLVVVW